MLKIIFSIASIDLEKMSDSHTIRLRRSIIHIIIATRLTTFNTRNKTGSIVM